MGLSQTLSTPAPAPPAAAGRRRCRRSSARRWRSSSPCSSAGRTCPTASAASSRPHWGGRCPCRRRRGRRTTRTKTSLKHWRRQSPSRWSQRWRWRWQTTCCRWRAGSAHRWRGSGCPTAARAGRTACCPAGRRGGKGHSREGGQRKAVSRGTPRDARWQSTCKAEL